MLADKQILSRILKYAVAEFGDMSVEEIISSIGNDIEVGAKSIDAGLSNLGRIDGTDTEDNIPGEGKIFFDIRFSAYHKQTEMKFLINIEAQRSSDPNKLGYRLENRILFYLARMISAQKQTEFYHSDYDSLKPVRSIWICMDHGEYEDSISEIGLDRKTVFGSQQDSYIPNLMKGIIINIRNERNRTESQNRLISMLERLLSRMDVKEKKRILTEEYGMIMTAELEGRIMTMCNLSQIIVEMGIEEGLEKGMEKGMEKGRIEERLHAIERMIRAGATKEQILAFGYTGEEYSEVEGMVHMGS